MRRQDTGSPETELFDLPLVVDPQVASEADREVAGGAARARREAAPEPEAEQIDLPTPTAAPAESGPEPGAAQPESLLARRLQAGLLDTAFHLAALAALIVGASALGAPFRPAGWPAYLLPLLEFSFLYTVFSITFWGRTPGMARAGLAVRASRAGAVTLGQAAGRWLGGVATLAFLGVPALLALRDGRSAADLLSGGRTVSTRS